MAAGASMTQGSLGADWVASLRAAFPAYEFVNAGSNGNTTADLLQRVDTDIVACRPAAVTLLIGTNDVRDGVPLEEYRANLRAIVDRVRSGTGARVALMSLPPRRGPERPDQPHPHPLQRRDQGHRRPDGADHLALHERMAGILRHGARTPYGFGFPLAFSVAAQHYLLGRTWDDIARAGGRELLVDHVHLTDRGGALVTELAGGWLSGITEP
ncbi:SGNH/GDSL hydrolase family protein [Nonomuraea thailandensis]